MKSKKMIKKLVLNKKTIVNVNNGEMHEVRGGHEAPPPPPTYGAASCPTGCNTYNLQCPLHLIWRCEDPSPTDR